MKNTPAAEVIEKAVHIKLVIFDIDGVFTDGQLHFMPSGEEQKVFHVHDGLGIKMLLQANIEAAIITGRESPIINQRMQKLGIKYIFQNQEEKIKAFEELLTQLNLYPEQVAYVGDDLPDIPVMRRVGLPITVPNAHHLVKEFSVWQTNFAGGQGAVREVCEFILQAQGLTNSFEQYLK